MELRMKKKFEVDGEKRKTYLKNNPRERSKLIFYLCLIALPVLQVCIFYIYVNFNSFILAFKNYSYNTDTLGYKVTFAGFQNFVEAWEIFSGNSYMILNSFYLFLTTTVLGLTLALIFSFYIYKGYRGSSVFRVMLFMPQIISSIIFATLFKYIVTDVYKVIAEKLIGEMPLEGLLSNPSTKFITILFYNLWISFGVNMILFSGAMSGIDQSIVESCRLDGANLVKEFWYITIPSIFGTLTTFIIVGLAGIFTNQMNLYDLYGINALDVASFGYYLYVQAAASDVISTMPGTPSYSVLSALGIILTCIIFPVVTLLKKLLLKFGPSTD